METALVIQNDIRLIKIKRILLAAYDAGVQGSNVDTMLDEKLFDLEMLVERKI